jgi:putative endonuclease
MSKSYFIYILTNKSRTFYTGVTSDLHHRVTQHREKIVSGFTKKYQLTKLVYFEEFSDVNGAIAREKQLKRWARIKKISLIESVNPGWKDLGDQLYRYS